MLCKYCLGLDFPEADSEIKIQEQVIYLRGGPW